MNIKQIEVGGVVLSDDEKVRFEYLESIIDEGLDKAGNDWFEVKFSIEKASLEVIAAIKVVFEKKGFSVGIFPILEDSILLGHQLVFVPGKILEGKKTISNDFPPVRQVYEQFKRDLRLLVRMPTRGRPVQALRILEKYKDMAGIPIVIEVVIDEDDETMLVADVLQRLSALGCVITVGNHKSKVEAVNGGKVEEWDVLLLASDDMVPVVNGYAVKALKEIEEFFPNLDGLVYFKDGYADERCVTLPVIGRRLYKQFGYIYEPSYKSLCCDVEQTEVLNAIGKIKYIDKMIIEHRHPAAGKARLDQLYERNDSLHEIDLNTLQYRRSLKNTTFSQFGFNAPPLWLSICIATIPDRRVSLELLVEHLYKQILQHPREVELLTDNRLGLTIGEKRQALLERAKGHYVVFVDDDDWISHDYVDKILSAIKGTCVDCVAIWGSMTTNGVPGYGMQPDKFHHSIKYSHWFEEEGAHRRCPNHLNPVKRDLALQVGFVSKSFAEDLEYSRKLLPLLKTEQETEGVLYYYWYWTKVR